MAIYRGDGGAGDATNDITINQITELSSDAQAAATAAASSATSASSSASAASTSATNAANSATSAGTSATNAASSASSASTSASNASTSETNAAASATASAASEAAAALSETAAAAYETNAATSATNAATSETNASNSATAAASSAGVAALNATSAADSASSAATSASNAATSETNAASSATSASNDAATATTKASEASTSASNAATSETNAAASESAAATSATNASASETNAAASETAAASSASAAATSETNAATSASGAATSASNAATSASNAATSETNAATSETNAAASATAAAASAASAASSDYATSSWYTTTNNSSNWDTAYGWGDHSAVGYLTAVNNLTSNIITTGQITAGSGGGGVALTVNDGGGNANVCFNHKSATPEQDGNSGRIVVNTDDTSNASMLFSLASGVTDGVPVTTTQVMAITETGVGIGTSSPSYELDVVGEASISTNIFCGTTLNNPAASGSTGIRVSNIGLIAASRDGGPALDIGRVTTDGSLVRFFQDGSQEGSIAVSGTTVSYNGGHLARWSQLADNTRDASLVKGTVLTNLDQMAVWGNEDNEQLNCMAVSSVEGDPNVAGVFVNWDEDDEDFTNDMNIAMTGDMVIRIAQGTTVQRGDLLMSAGDGTAKPQGDDIVRSKTIAKVTSTHVSHTYNDGSYLVPCVLMAC